MENVDKNRGREAGEKQRSSVKQFVLSTIQNAKNRGNEAGEKQSKMSKTGAGKQGKNRGVQINILCCPQYKMSKTGEKQRSSVKHAELRESLGVVVKRGGN